MNLRFSVHYFLMFTMIATIGPYVQLFLRARGFSSADVGYLQGIMTFAGSIGPIVAGRMGDRHGRRLTMVAGLALFSTVPPLINRVEAFWTAAVLMVLLGLLARTVIPLTETLASTELDDPARDYGKVRVWGSMGFVVALLGIGGLRLVDESSSDSIMRAMVLTTAVCLVSALFLPERQRLRAAAGAAPGLDSRPRDRFDRVLWLFFTAMALHQIAMAAYYSFFTNYLRDVYRMEQAAWVWALGALAETPFLFFGGPIIRRFGIRRMLITAMLAVTLRFAIYATGVPLLAILPVQMLHGLIFGLSHAASIEFLRRHLPASRRAFGMALYMSIPIGGGSLLGNSLGGILVEHWGYRMLYGVYAAVPLAGVGLVLAVGRRFEFGAGDCRD